ncbi:MAG: site-2 protease family protein [Anaerofustis stercorihominis]|nr:site-2 protease family protein [Anaerofustis stercorihominis]
MIETILDYVVIIAVALLSIMIHECAHGYAALYMGDSTAKDRGRLTLNPVKHIDPFGLLCMVLFKFGWAKPVPINPVRFSDRKKGMRLVSIAGVTANMIMSIVFAVLLRIFMYFDLYYLNLFFVYGIQLNIGYAVFNLVPLPPLDGSKLIATFLPRKYEYYMYKYEKYLYIILIALIYTGVLTDIISIPINGIYYFILNAIVF